MRAEPRRAPEPAAAAAPHDALVAVDLHRYDRAGRQRVDAHSASGSRRRRRAPASRAAHRARPRARARGRATARWCGHRSLCAATRRAAAAPRRRSASTASASASIPLAAAMRAVMSEIQHHPSCRSAHEASVTRAVWPSDAAVSWCRVFGVVGEHRDPAALAAQHVAPQVVGCGENGSPDSVGTTNQASSSSSPSSWPGTPARVADEHAQGVELRKPRSTGSRPTSTRPDVVEHRHPARRSRRGRRAPARSPPRARPARR